MNQRDTKAVQAVALGAGVVVTAAILASNPNCNRGCKTVLEHITTHVLSDVITGLLG